MEGSGWPAAVLSCLTASRTLASHWPPEVAGPSSKVTRSSWDWLELRLQVDNQSVDNEYRYISRMWIRLIVNRTLSKFISPIMQTREARNERNKFCSGCIFCTPHLKCNVIRSSTITPRIRKTG
jgi:hypothetical protein